MKLLPLLASATLLSGCLSTSLVSPPSVQPAAAKIIPPKLPAYAATVTLRKTIIVAAGQVFDGKMTRYKGDPAVMGKGDQAEGQEPLFEVRGSGTLKNVVIGDSAADGIHCFPANGATIRIQAVHYEKVGEDAISILSGDATSKVEIVGCSFRNSVDKTIQANTPAKVYVRDCYAENFTRFARACGTCGPKAYWIEISDLTAKNGDTVLKMTNPQAHGRIVRGTYQNVARLGHAENKAQIVIVK